MGSADAADFDDDVILNDQVEVQPFSLSLRPARSGGHVFSLKEADQFGG